MDTTLSTDDISLKAPDAKSQHIVRIEPSTGWVSLRLDELWEYKELLYFLTWRDIKVRYKQTALGAGWAIIQPVLTMVLFGVVFGRLAKLGPAHVPYAPWSFAALVPWFFFSNGLQNSSTSIVGNSALITKIYFPRLAIPFSTVLGGLVDLALSFSVLIAIMAWFHLWPTANIVFLPYFVLLALVTSLGCGLWLSALNVKFRDIRYIVPFLTTFWQYATPIVWPLSKVHGGWKIVVGLNPMSGVVEGFRWALLGVGEAPGPLLAASSVVALLLLISGCYYFRRMEKMFADIV